MQERIQKILSARGIASRRKAEEYMLAGQITVNGKIAKLGDKADPAVDRIEVAGKVVEDRKKMLYYVMNKPEGVETVNIERGSRGSRGNLGVRGNRRSSKSSTSSISSNSSPTVYDLLPPSLRGKIYPVGRLDKDSSGLLLFTNDGVLAYRLTHPKFHHDKEYEVILDRPITPMDCRKLAEGFVMDGSKTKPLDARKIRTNAIRMTLTEGRNRQIRRMCQAIGYTVKDLRRVRIMTLTDTRLRPGSLRALTEEEKSGLLSAIGV